MENLGTPNITPPIFRRSGAVPGLVSCHPCSGAQAGNGLGTSGSHCHSAMKLH